MPSLDLRDHDQKLADAAAVQSLQRWRAAQTVRNRFPDSEECAELLGCLGLLDVVHPV